MVKRTFLTLSIFLGSLAGVFLCTGTVRSEQDSATITTTGPCEPSSYGYEGCWYDGASNYCPYPSVQADTSPAPVSEEVAEKPCDDPVANESEYDGYESKYYGYHWEYDDYDSAYEDFAWTESAADLPTETIAESEQADADAEADAVTEVAVTATVTDESAERMRGYCDDWAEYCYDEEYRYYEMATQADCVPEAQAQDADADQPAPTTVTYDHEYPYGYDYDYWYNTPFDDGYAYQFEPSFDRTEELFEVESTQVADESIETETAEVSEEITDTETSIDAPTLRDEAAEQAHGCYYSDCYYGDCYYGDYYRDDYYDSDYDDSMTEEASQTSESTDDSMNRAAILTLARSLDQMGSALQMLSRRLTEMAAPEVAARTAASDSIQH
jgi:hypothetical protein